MIANKIQPARRLGDLRPYAPPVRNGRISLALDNNEGVPVDASLLALLRDLSPEQIARYPDQSALETQIANGLGIGHGRVVITNGGDDAIDRVCRAVLSPGDAMLTHGPGFVMIPRWAQLAGACVRSVEWLSGDFPLNPFMDAIDESVRLVAIVSPCNPTGLVVGTDELIRIAARAREAGAVLMLDQAYVEFADEDPIGELVCMENVVIVRTFSKAMGCAGLRVGYAIAMERIATWLRTVGGPYPVSTPSLLLAAACFERRTEREEIIAQTRANRTVMVDRLRSLGAGVISSQGNFVLARFDDAAHTHARLLEQGISVRRFLSGGDIENYLRITVPAEQSQLAQFLTALGAIGAPS